jgi:hypothetical protein
MKFTTPNIVVENPIPKETMIYYSKTKALIVIVFSAVVFCFGIYVLFLGSDYLAGALLCFVLGCVFIYFKYKTFTDNTPQIVVNADGLQTVNNPFYKWDEITEASVTILEIRGTTYHHFTYKNQQGDELSIRIDNFNISIENFKLLLRFYKEKYKNSNFTYLDLENLKNP